MYHSTPHELSEAASQIKINVIHDLLKSEAEWEKSSHFFLIVYFPYRYQKKQKR